MATPNLSYQNFYTSTLSAGITATDTTIYINSLPTGTEGYLVIEPDSSTNKEIIYYTSKGANFVTLPSIAAGRGIGGTTAVSHNSSSTVQMNVVAEHFKALQDGTAFAVGGIGATAYADGWTPILGSTPNTVTYNGNRNYDLVFNSVDLTSTLSPGMRLKATRTVAAPTQCTDLEASSSQYYSKASPAGMTFTDDFVVSAWIKLESYTGSTQGIVSRFNGTSGYYFAVQPTGQIVLAGFNASGSNFSQVQSYASVPLNKWIHVSAQLDMSTFTATTTTSYVMFDGVDVASAVSRGGTNPTALVQAGNLEIGSYNAGNFFDGKIAQVAIYSAKIPQATIKASCNQTLSGSETSLISAYSFNNVITDLNTTNANNLTAQGSAVATNADSPFANAVTAGLLEYGLVQKATFSTNTTVNVQVPEGCAIPTTGGVTAVSYSTAKSPYGYISDRGRWDILYLHFAAQSQATPAANTWYAFNTLAFVKPTGSFTINPNVLIRIDGSTTGEKDVALAFTNTGAAPVGVLISSDYYYINYGTTARKLCSLSIFTADSSSASTYSLYMECGGVSITVFGTYVYSPVSGNYNGSTITLTPTGL